MKTTAKLMAICMMMASLGFAQGDTKKDDGMAKTKKAKKGKKGKKSDAAPAATPATK